MRYASMALFYLPIASSYLDPANQVIMAGGNSPGRCYSQETFKSIGSSPAAGVAALDFKPEGTRRFPMGNYIIYYRLVRGAKPKVLISRVLHGKRRQKRSYYQAS